MSHQLIDIKNKSQINQCKLTNQCTIGIILSKTEFSQFVFHLWTDITNFITL